MTLDKYFSMKQTQLFSKTTKENPKDEESINARLLIRAGFVNKEMAGVYTFNPLGLRVLRNIEQIIRDEMVNIGGQEIVMPALQPKANWDKTGRWDSYDVLFRFKSLYSQTEYVIGPTHEEIVAPLLKRFVSSYRDLPQYVFQIQEKFRDEKRAKSGLLRGREFVMKDLYSFHVDDEDCEKYYEGVRKAYERIFKRVRLKTIYTFASGGSFSQYSHEFQVVAPAGEDTIYICGACGIAVNDEIIRKQSTCPECGNKKLEPQRSIEVGNIFKLKTRYSEAFDFTYTDEEGKPRPVVMGCYGIGLPRLMGAIVEVWHDDSGIIWPETVAPFAIHLLALGGGEKQAETIYNQLSEKGIDVLYDNRRDVAAGEKFADADLIGIPLRVVVSEKTVAINSVEVKKRKEAKIQLVKIPQVQGLIQ